MIRLVPFISLYLDIFVALQVAFGVKPRGLPLAFTMHELILITWTSLSCIKLMRIDFRCIQKYSLAFWKESKAVCYSIYVIEVANNRIIGRTLDFICGRKAKNNVLSTKNPNVTNKGLDFVVDIQISFRRMVKSVSTYKRLVDVLWRQKQRQRNPSVTYTSRSFSQKHTRKTFLVLNRSSPALPTTKRMIVKNILRKSKETGVEKVYLEEREKNLKYKMNLKLIHRADNNIRHTDLGRVDNFFSPNNKNTIVKLSYSTTIDICTIVTHHIELWKGLSLHHDALIFQFHPDVNCVIRNSLKTKFHFSGIRCGNNLFHSPTTDLTLDAIFDLCKLRKL
ncbi:hypothetical protein Csa_013551 [Cucumis sativus]|nr:hypothetical protein Csa_013551 [Cucumis sativus]